MAAPIIVGIDFSPTSRTALDAAAKLAEDLESPLVLVHGAHAPHLGWAASDAHLDAVQEVLAEARMDDVVELATEWANPLRERGLTVDTYSEGGDPVELLVRIAKERDAGLIVVGHHGWGFLKRVILGSTAKGLMDHSHLPVLVVPHAPTEPRAQG